MIWNRVDNCGDRAIPAALTRRRFVVGSAGLAAAAALTGCGSDGEPAATVTASATGSPPASGPSGDVTMSLVTLADQSTDPHVSRVAVLAPITTSCFEQFARWDRDGRLVPALASSMEEPPDHLQLTFRLRDDATFWDGSPVTAEDARWSFERYTTVSPGDTYQATTRDLVDGVDTPDPHTVVVRLKRPTTLRLSFGIVWPRGWNIASRAHHERVGEDAFRRLPMATGPFRVVENVAQERVRLEAYAGHYERPPKVASVTMHVVPEQNTRVARLLAGEAGFIDGIAGPAREQLQGRSGYTIRESEAAALTTLYFQEPEAAPYRDQRLREALRFATDQQGLIDALLGGAGAPAPPAHIFPVTSGYDAGAFPPQEFDPARARALVEEAALAGASVKLWGYDSSSAPRIPQMLQAVAGMWRDLGIDVDLEILEAGAYFQRYEAHSLGGITALASGAWFDGESLLRTDYLKGQPYSPPTTDAISAMIEDLSDDFDEAERLAAIQAVYREIIDGAWSITLPYANAAWALRDDRIAGWEPATGWAYPHAFETLVAAGA